MLPLTNLRMTAKTKLIKITTKVAYALLKKTLILDDSISISRFLGEVADYVKGFCRGIFVHWIFISVGHGTSIKSKSKLKSTRSLTRIGRYCTIDCLSENGIHLGANFSIGDYSKIVASGSLSRIGKGVRIGDNVGIGEYSYIGGAGGVTIGANTIAGQYLSIHPENHCFSGKDVLIRMQSVTRKGIIIGSNCWIGAKVTFLDGVTIGNGTVIGAGSVVTKSFPSNSVIAGVPARLIACRL